VFYHRHWSPVDIDKYPGDLAKSCRILYDSAALSAVEIRRISNSPVADLAQLQALAFVVRYGLLGTAADQTLGNSDELRKAQIALKHMSAAT
jgi:hypothetical protein